MNKQKQKQKLDEKYFSEIFDFFFFSFLLWVEGMWQKAAIFGLVYDQIVILKTNLTKICFH